jgi:hypothetical protein
MDELKIVMTILFSLLAFYVGYELAIYTNDSSFLPYLIPQQ